MATLWACPAHWTARMTPRTRSSTCTGCTCWDFTRLAIVMLGDRASAEDVVQDAFCGLYTHWRRLSDPAKALPYLRSSVLNGCRNHRRRRHRAGREPTGWENAESAESAVLL